MKVLSPLIKQIKKEHVFLLLVLIISAVAHGYNMFHFPYYENDEGVYVSQAWSIVKEGKLAPYTYWYDHAPAGWILIALWSIVSGGFFTFGFSVNTGRVLMLLLHLASCYFLYKISLKLTKSTFIACFAVLIFSLTPLGIYFQRRVLLDNIMTFWVLFSLLLLFAKQQLRYILLSGLLFGIGVLSKENAIFFIPVFLYIIYLWRDKKQRNFAIVEWLTVTFLVVSTYFLYALLKGEMFPTGTLLGGTKDHVSLLGTLREQYDRGGGGLFSKDSLFWSNMSLWTKRDAAIIYVGLLATLINLLIGIKDKSYRVIGLLSLVFWFFLARGGIVIEFYVVPIIPFLGLNIAAAAWWVTKQIKTIKVVPRIIIPLFLSLSVLTYFFFTLNFKANSNVSDLYLSDQTTPQIQAVNWMLKNPHPNDFFVIDNYGYVDLQTENKDTFKHAEWYWKVDRDPDITVRLLRNNPANIDYIALTPQMEHDLQTAGLAMTSTAWDNATMITRFWKDGWGVEFWKTKSADASPNDLSRTWNSYQQTFIKSGKVTDPAGNVTTSEGQSYALLRAAWMKDPKSFAEIWKWTQQHLQLSNHLFAWKLQEKNGKDIREDSTASDADEDIALALVFAGKQFNNQSYLDEAKKIISSIWENEVQARNGLPILVAGNWGKNSPTATINPSYLSPAWYKIFATIDTTHPWNDLATSSYSLLSTCMQAPLDKTTSVNLPPDWCGIDPQNVIVASPMGDKNSSNFSYDAFRTVWRLTLDYQWFNSQDAKNILNSISFLKDKWNQDKKLASGYTHDGQPTSTTGTTSFYAGSLGYFIVTDPDLAKAIYTQKIAPNLHIENGVSYWEDPKNYYTQNWAWFGTALYTNSLPNLSVTSSGPRK